MNRYGHKTRIFARGVALAIALGMSGAHWMALQTVAWARMLVVYSHTETLQTAIGQTFDGRHPCPLCRVIQAANQPAGQQELNPATVAVQVELALCETDAPFYDMLAVRRISPMRGSAHFRHRDPPPVPPPRLLTGVS